MKSEQESKYLKENPDSCNERSSSDDELIKLVKEIKDSTKFISFCVGNISFIIALIIIGSIIKAL